MRTRGYFGIGIYVPAHNVNVAGLWRSAYNFGASFIFTIGGQKYKRKAADTTNTTNHIPLHRYQTFEQFYENLPLGCMLVGVEQSDRAKDLGDFWHPHRAVYLLGNEVTGIPIRYLDKCHKIVQIESRQCLNVHVAGSVVMWDRQNKG